MAIVAEKSLPQPAGAFSEQAVSLGQVLQQSKPQRLPHIVGDPFSVQLIWARCMPSVAHRHLGRDWHRRGARMEERLQGPLEGRLDQGQFSLRGF